MSNSLPVPRRRNKGVSIDTIRTLRVVHHASRAGHQSNNQELIDAAQTVLSAITLGIDQPRQYVPPVVAELIDLLIQHIGISHEQNRNTGH